MKEGGCLIWWGEAPEKWTAAAEPLNWSPNNIARPLSAPSRGPAVDHGLARLLCQPVVLIGHAVFPDELAAQEPRPTKLGRRFHVAPLTSHDVVSDDKRSPRLTVRSLSIG